MNMNAFNGNAGFTPSFEDERADLAIIFADLDARNSTTLHGLTHAFFEEGITKAKIDHAIQNLTPLQLDKRLDTCIRLTGAYSTIHSLLLAQINYVLASPTMKRAQDMSNQVANELYRIAKEFDRHTMNEYSKGLKFMRDLGDVGIESKETARDLFEARLTAHFSASPADLSRALIATRTDILESQRDARVLDLEIAQFKMVCVGAVQLLASNPLKGDSILQQQYARQLFNGTDAEKAPGLVDLNRAINLVHILMPAFQADKNATLSL